MVGLVYLTNWFGFPRKVSASAKLNQVSEYLKSKKRIYQLTRSEFEVRVNNYNPLLLLLWKANIDIQFVAESSLALAHYVSGYVTKAERSNIQEIWQEVSKDKSICSRLWSFGIHFLRSRECGLYEAGDLLLGDHLTEKSDTMKWVNVTMPHKRSRRLKDHRVLQDMAKANPDSNDIFEGNLLENFYLERPDAMEDVCLYDFVSKYDYAGKDEDGARKYKLLNKPRLPNHKIFNPEKEYQKEAYYYSLLLLFVPFRDDSELLEDDETAEEAFERLVTDNSKAYHEKLHKALQAQAMVKEINEARRAEPKDEKEENDNKMTSLN